MNFTCSHPLTLTTGNSETQRCYTVCLSPITRKMLIKSLCSNILTHTAGIFPLCLKLSWVIFVIFTWQYLKTEEVFVFQGSEILFLKISKSFETNVQIELYSFTSLLIYVTKLVGPQLITQKKEEVKQMRKKSMKNTNPSLGNASILVRNNLTIPGSSTQWEYLTALGCAKMTEINVPHKT